MTVSKIKEIVKEVLSINLVDWLTKSQIELIEIENRKFETKMFVI